MRDPLPPEEDPFEQPEDDDSAYHWTRFLIVLLFVVGITIPTYLMVTGITDQPSATIEFDVSSDAVTVIVDDVDQNATAIHAHRSPYKTPSSKAPPRHNQADGVLQHPRVGDVLTVQLRTGHAIHVYITGPDGTTSHIDTYHPTSQLATPTTRAPTAATTTVAKDSGA